MEQSEYEGPGVFGYETDLPAMRVAMISVHTSPLASLGSADAGGMNVYIRELACHLGMLGVEIDIFTRRTSPGTPEVAPLCPGVNVISVKAGPPEPVHKDSLFPLLPQFASEAVLSSVRRGVRYDVVHSHYWLSGWVAHLLRRYWETPFIQMFHTTAHMKESS
ncbi:MAG TPA: glycosyltransferase, partial [Thermomicrobiales bacterium]|nr:glycosyltransferase [Thermomicrobiales bacterium]